MKYQQNLNNPSLFKQKYELYFLCSTLRINSREGEVRVLRFIWEPQIVTLPFPTRSSTEETASKIPYLACFNIQK